MSHIKRLKLKGFKSFSNPTVLSFETGFNTVVGANGSGKSNIFDALCFVLGRLSSKELRTEKLGNLVFNGGKNLKPAKEAEVSIYLSNEERELLSADLDEVKISRVVTKEGKSKYLLNNQKVTRTEIVEVLRKASIDPDGYNVILQGDIMRIVNMSTVERRELIEEISNISGYEEKREKGLKKLDKVELDLKEADLLMEEKTKYIRELKSEKEQAEKYHRAKEDYRYNGLLLLKAKIIRNTILKQKKEDELKEKEEKLSVYRSKLDEFESGSKEIESEITKLEKEIEVKSHEDFISVTNRITEIESEIQKLSEKKAENKKQIEEIKSKNNNVNETISQNKKEIEKLESELKSFSEKKQKLEKEIKEFDSKLSILKKGVSSDAFDKIDELEGEIDELNLKKHDKTLIKQDNSIQIEKLNTKLEHYEEEQKRLDGLNASNKEQIKELDKLRSELKKMILEVSEKSNKNAETSAKINNLQREYGELVEENSRLKMKLDSSREAIASNKAVDTIIKFKQRDTAIAGTVAQLASVPEKYSMALETAAGRSLFNIVVNDDKTAVKYINYLKENRVGSATFLPLNKVNKKFKLDDSVLNKKGVIDYAINLIKFDKQYENIFHLIYGDLLVIEKIEDARDIGIGDYKMVTIDGDLVTKSGAMSGGFKNRKQGLGLFKDDKLSKRADEVESKVITLKSTLDLLRDEKEDQEREIYDLRHKKIEVEGEVAKFEKILSIEGRDSNTIRQEVEAILSDKSVIENSLNKIDRELTELNEKISKLQAKKSELKAASGMSSQGNVLTEITKLEEKRDKLKEELMATTSQVDLREIKIKSVLKPEIINLNKIFIEGDTAIKKLNQSISDLTDTLKKLDEELKEKRAIEKELSKGYKNLISQRDKLREDKKKLELKYEKEFEIFDKIKEGCAQLRYAIGEYENLNKNLDADLEIFYTEVKTELVADEDDNEGEEKLDEVLSSVESRINGSPIDVKELQNKVNNLKTRLSSFGSINMKAVEIYDKLKEEFDKLLEKRETLNSEKAEILEFIAEMDGKKKIKFMETFEKLRSHFIEIFSRLSTKGIVELNLENEADLFNSGVEIKVRLSERNYLDIKALSGGEKTITAVAFIFAVQEFRPASFYILDEIDAALDIMNCEKLGKLIKENAHKAQYIVVSHSEHFIQSSETIYGVTMDANKISSVLSLDLKDMKDYVDDDEVAKA